MSYLESEYNLDQYITVFWKCNRINNNYIDKLIDLCTQIINIDLTGLDLDVITDDIKLLLDNFNKFLSSIDNLRESLINLLSTHSINKFKKYENEYNTKINKLYDFIKLNPNYDITKEQFIKFMHNNTPEGRIIKQNSGALSLLELIDKAIKIDRLIKNK